MFAFKLSILADTFNNLAALPRRTWGALTLGVALLLTGVAVTAIPQNAQAPIEQSFVAEPLSNNTLKVLPVETQTPFTREERVLPGDSLSSLFQRLGVKDAYAQRFLTQDETAHSALRLLRAGRAAFAKTDAQGALLSLTLPYGTGEKQLTVEREDDHFKTKLDTPPITQTITEMKSGEIDNSLFGATDKAELPDSIANKLTDIFGTEIDFNTDLRKGDRFSVIYENQIDLLGTSRPGRILAAEFINQGERHAVILFKDNTGKETFYTEDGRSLEQGFLRTPLEFSRISSGFSTRFHPILKQWRDHKGVDFAAPKGTAVKASSNGSVDFIGTQNGYGNVIVLSHRNGYETAYAHLNNFAEGLKKGDAVTQGQIIGYVGQTGWATGMHLHYEVRIKGVAQDPMTVALPSVEPLKGEALARFKAQATDAKNRFALLNTTALAYAQNKP